MYINYNQFILENNNKSSPKDYGIEDYKFNDDGTLDVNGNIYTSKSEKIFKKLPFNFGTINGDFICRDSGLTSLVGSPKIVNGRFDVSDNKITSLEGSPIEVTGEFSCTNNKLTDLKGSPKKTGNYFVYGNPLTSLEGIAKNINCISYNNTLIKDDIEEYPLTIITDTITANFDPLDNHSSTYNIREKEKFNNFYQGIQKLIYKNRKIFENLLDDKIRFHQIIMILDPSLIKYYKTISLPKNKTSLLI